MNENEFKSKMAYADTMKKLDDRPDYWSGYIRGLRRRYHGEKFGTDDEHTLWMESISSPDEQQSERGRGYRDGLAEITLRPMFCLRCGYQWLPRSTENSTICPKCKSPYWNKPKKDRTKIGTFKQDIEWIISLKLEPLRDFLEMLSTSETDIDRAAFIAQSLLENAERKIYEVTEYIKKNYGMVELVKAMCQQSVETGTILDVVFTPAENGKSVEVLA